MESKFKVPDIRIIKLKNVKEIRVTTFGVRFPQISLIPKIPYNRYNLILRWPYHFGNTSFDVKLGGGDIGLHYVYACSWFWVFGPGLSKLP